MRLFFYIGIFLVGCGFLLAAAETAWHSMPGSRHGFIVPAYDLWQALSPSGLIIFEIKIVRFFGDWAWDPIILTFLNLPAWFIFGAPGMAMLISCRPNKDPESVEEMAKILESLELYDHLTKRAREEDVKYNVSSTNDVFHDSPNEDDQKQQVKGND